MGDSYTKEQWEKVIEHELNFYVNIQEWEDKLLEGYYESQMIRYPVTTFDEEVGRVYLSCPTTEEQALYRIQVKESVQALLKKAVKRINRLNNALAQLNEHEQDIISSFYFERDLPELYMARSLGYSTKRAFLEEKQKVLKKLYAIYEKERSNAVQVFNNSLKEEIKRKIDLFKKSKLSPKLNIV